MKSDNYKSETDFERKEFENLINKIRTLQNDEFSENFDSSLYAKIDKLDTNEFEREEKYYNIIDLLRASRLYKYKYAVGIAASIIILYLGYNFIFGPQLYVSEEYMSKLKLHTTFVYQLTEFDIDENGFTDTYKADTNSDGNYDLFKYDKDENSAFESAACDLNYDGIIDVQIQDKDNNGTLEYYVLDINFDGKFDFEAYDYNNDGIPDKFTRI